MESSLLNGMCRCCASEGVFKDVKTAYTWMGEEEVYADMLKQCFDICLSTSEQGDDGGICEVCITQLRNAANFKKQVLTTEEQFKKHALSKLFKPSIIKLEVSPEDDNDSDDNALSGDDGYSGPEFEVPIKTEVDDPKPKKRAAASKASTSRAKKAKADNGETSTKRVQRKAAKTASEKIETRTLRVHRATKPRIYELEKHRSNIRIILQSSNATPIRCRGGIGYACSFCAEEFPDPADLKRHTIHDHDDKIKCKFMAGKMMFSYLVKLDITNLICKICSTEFATLDSFVEHLIESHNKPIHTDIKSHIMPFKFENDDALICMFCQNVFNKFKNLQQHMNMHCRNFICDVCDAGFINRHILSSHTEGHKKGIFKCDICSKVFDTLRKKKSHEKSVHVHANLLSKCGYCHIKFTNYKKKDEHLAKMHGVVRKMIKCHACDKTFDNKSSLTIHTKRDHLMERRFTCTLCEMKFFGSNELKLHMVKHTGVREFKCDICLKSYGRKKTLTEHMRIHNDDRRFKCEHCGQAFVQKCSWKGHMRNRHGELVY
ncbi:uncharacterized protein LOC142985169 isoform X7 [Anticarsia gemmatalis]|uniref:uncharacterized protein LOC142985169 isoform X7 n=1 Tax=Anticarsia gemmatalis TaxID=129554 RepID=UPI003F75D5A1